MKFGPVAVAFITATTLGHAGVIRVGPGLLPSTIQPAVDAAVDGDVILVESGIYPSFVIRNKELTVVANTGADVKIDGAIRIGGLDGTRSIVLQGLKNTGGPVTHVAAQFGLRVVNSSGLVLVQDCTLMGGTRPSGPGAGVSAHRPSVLVENSLAVVFSRCTLRGALPISNESPLYMNNGYEAGWPSEGALVVNSALHFFESTVIGGNGFVGHYDGGMGAHALWAEHSAVYLSGTTVAGGNGSQSSFNCQAFGGGGGDGLRGSIGSSFILRASTCVGGAGMPSGGSPFCPQYAGNTGLPVQLLDTSTTNVIPGAAAKLVATALAREGETAQLTYSGTSGDVVERHSSREGTALWDPTLSSVQVPAFGQTFRVAPVGTLGASSTDQFIVVPELGAGVQHRVLFYQAAHNGPAGQQLGTPRALIMLDGAF
jgi:hypothetical protein